MRGHWRVYSYDRSHNHPGRAPGRQGIAPRDGRRDTAPGCRGLIRIWLDRKFVDRLAEMRRPGESYSGVILRVAKAGS
jgi:hypothetical protein